MKEKASTRAKLFEQELKKQIQKLSSQYGYYMPACNMLEVDNNIYLNLSFFNRNPDDQYAEWWNEYCEKFGMKKEWIGLYFVSPVSSKKMQIKGIDIDGGDKSVRTRDENGLDYHYKPESIIHLVMHHAKI